MDMKLSISQLGKVLGVRKRRIWDWENSITKPSIHLYPKVIEFLGYDPLHDTTETYKAMIQNYRRIHGLSYQQLAKHIGISYTDLVQFTNHNEGSKRTIKMIQQFFEKPSK